VFIDTLPPKDLVALKAAGRPRRYVAGAHLFREGERCEAVYLLESGRLKICHHSIDGTEEVLAIRGPGDIVGELSVIGTEHRSATGIALERLEVVIVGADAFRQILVERPAITLALLESVVNRLRDADRKRIEFGTVPTLGRVSRRLLELADRFGEADGGTVIVRLPITQSELAGWVGASREAVVKALSALRRLGYVETARREVRILDRPGLVRVSGI
jgi:CRP-like cAMP-binding protein